ncbi:MAG: hypothetical protein KAR20_10355 [Candidatus Heimdallarchaeota archaeon]|nr:hypothetical protein [Candidatus Heimdallarchaeota archaeon]
MDDITIKDGYMYGDWRAPENLWRGLTTSIHDDGVAKKVGMRGGTIPGTIHLSMFAPVLLKIFGDKWFEKGSLSLYYTFATIDREEVRAVVKIPPEGAQDVQVEARAEMRDGKVIASGTVALGDPDELSYLQALDLKNSPPEDLRILAGNKPGDILTPRDVSITQKQADKGLGAITDHLDYCKGKSPWGNSILSPTAMFSLMSLGYNQLDTDLSKAVPFYGATEITNIAGPAMVDVPYRVTGKIASVGVSRKTEYFWVDAILEEKETGNKVASMRHMNRFMKAGSPLYESQ